MRRISMMPDASACRRKKRKARAPMLDADFEWPFAPVLQRILNARRRRRYAAIFRRYYPSWRLHLPYSYVDDVLR